MTNIKIGDRVMAPGLQFGYVEAIDESHIADVCIDGINHQIHIKFLTYIPELAFSNIRLGVNDVKCGAMVKDLNGCFHYITRLIDVSNSSEVITLVCTTNTDISFYSPDDLIYIG
jgi:hypothetical protein